MADTQTLHGLDDVLRKLRAFPKAMGKNGGPVRKGLRKGAMVIAREAQANVRRIVAEPNVDGQPTKSTGALEKAIGAVRMKRPQLEGANEGFEVKVRGAVLRKYANTRFNRARKRDGAEYTKEGVNEYYGRMLETGTERMAPHPWLQPAYFAKRQEALLTVVKEITKGVDQIIRKLSGR